MYNGEEGYLALLKEIMDNGKDRGDRTGTGTRSIFSAQIEFDLTERFPLLTTKKMATRAIVGELLWMLDGKSDLKSLRKLTFGNENSDKKTIWDDNIKTYQGSEQGGALYGEQWRGFVGYVSGDYGFVDQLKIVLRDAKANPESRRLLVSSWNAAEIEHDQMALPPCHFAWQIYIEDGYLDLKWNQRSCDVFLGIPFNIASYAALAQILAQWLGLKPRMLVGDLTNIHIYHNHFDAVNEQLRRTPVWCNTKLVVPDNIELDNLEDFWAGDFSIESYESHPPIKAPMAV